MGDQIQPELLLFLRPLALAKVETFYGVGFNWRDDILDRLEKYKSYVVQC